MRSRSSPSKRSSTAVTPGPSDAVTRVRTPSRACSQPEMRAALALPRSLCTSAEIGGGVPPSNAEASSERQGVVRVHARSVSPGA